PPPPRGAAACRSTSWTYPSSSPTPERTVHTGVVAAGHPVTAEAGARVLREGGNAVDAAVGAMLTSFVAEPLLTGLGAGGYMLVGGGGRQPALLDFFVAAPTERRSPTAAGEPAAVLEAIDVSFGDAAQ